LPISPMIELTLMIRPLPRSTMWPSTACDKKNAPERLTFKTLCQSSSVSLRIVLSMVMPALLIKMSSRPCCSRTSFTTRRQSSGEATLPRCVETGAEKRSAKSFANCSARSTFPLKPAAIVAPCEPSSSDMAAPMPRIPPVTSATRPVSPDPTGWLASSSATLTVVDSVMKCLLGSSHEIWSGFIRSSRIPRLTHNLEPHCPGQPTPARMQSRKILLGEELALRAVRLHPPGRIEDLRLDEVEPPEPGPGQVLVCVYAAAITRDELEWPVDRLPAIPSYELSGILTADANGLSAGAQVFALT